MSSSREVSPNAGLIIQIILQWLGTGSFSPTQVSVEQMKQYCEQFAGDAYKQDRDDVREWLIQYIESQMSKNENEARGLEQANSLMREQYQGSRKRRLEAFTFFRDNIPLVKGSGSAKDGKKKVMVALEGAIQLLFAQLFIYFWSPSIAFFVYVSMNDLKWVESALKKAKNEKEIEELVNYRDPMEGCTPLMAAAEHGYVEMVKFLLAVPGIDVNATSKNENKSALQLAELQGHQAIVSVLSAHANMPVLATDKFEKPASLLSEKVFSQDMRKATILRILHQWKPGGSLGNIKDDIDRLNRVTSQLTGNADKSDRKEYRKMLVQGIKGIERAIVNHKDATSSQEDQERRNSYLETMLAFFISLRDDLQMIGGYGSAEKGKKRAMVEIEMAIQAVYGEILKAGSNPCYHFFKQVEKNKIAEVGKLLASVDDETKKQWVQHHDPVGGFTPLIVAAGLGHLEMVKILLAIPGVDVNAVSREQKMSALQFAVQNGHREVVSTLLTVEDIDLYYRDYYGQTAKHVAYVNSFGDIEQDIIREMSKRYEKSQASVKEKLDELKGALDISTVESIIKFINQQPLNFDGDDSYFYRKQLRRELVAIFETRVQSLLNNPNCTLEALKLECYFLVALRDELNLIKGMQGESADPKTSMVAIKGLIEKLALKEAEKLPSKDVNDVKEAILILALPSKEVPSIISDLMDSYFLSSDQALVDQARRVMAKLSPDQKKRVKEKLLSHVQGVAAEYKNYLSNDHWIYALSNDCQDAKNKTVLFEIFRTGDNKKVNYDTGTWIKFLSLMTNGNFLKPELSKKGGVRSKWYSPFHGNEPKEEEMTGGPSKSKSPSPDGKSGH